MEPKIAPDRAVVFLFRYLSPFEATMTTNKPLKKDTIPSKLRNSLGFNMEISF